MTNKCDVLLSIYLLIKKKTTTIYLYQTLRHFISSLSIIIITVKHMKHNLSSVVLAEERFATLRSVIRSPAVNNSFFSSL